ncbi:MAG: phenylacetate--CoA ligase family protein [Oscillospiraceae bacterium]|nr:phenylacetate--CoA ligase family protein [Oscillospiraceae bacterium]MBR6561597.1 phenylacetate--CoA ligase family protein [Oscillospiraceae bacterium]
MLDSWIAGEMGLPVLEADAVAAWRMARLREVIDYAKRNSVFYASRLAGALPENMADFEALPLMTADDLRAHGGEMLCVSPDAVDRIVTLRTSGSTGAAKRIYFTHGDQARTVDYFAHGMAEFIQPGERVMSLFPGESPGSLNDLLSKALAKLGSPLAVFGFPTPERYDALAQEILQSGTQCIVGPAETLAAAAARSRETGFDVALGAQLRSVLLAAAYVPQRAVDEIENTWHCRVNEHYGMTETALGGAVGCTEIGAYHVWESDLYYEIINPETGRVLPAGEMGEIVVTTLRREAMPFIRYRTGDRSRFLPGNCACGSAIRRLERVQERPVGKKFLREGEIRF